MGPEESVDAIQLVKQSMSLPCHYNTWPPIAQDVEAWAARVRGNTTSIPIMMNPATRSRFRHYGNSDTTNGNNARLVGGSLCALFRFVLDFRVWVIGAWPGVLVVTAVVSVAVAIGVFIPIGWKVSLNRFFRLHLDDCWRIHRHHAIHDQPRCGQVVGPWGIYLFLSSYHWYFKRRPNESSSNGAFSYCWNWSLPHW